MYRQYLIPVSELAKYPFPRSPFAADAFAGADSSTPPLFL